MGPFYMPSYTTKKKKKHQGAHTTCNKAAQSIDAASRQMVTLADLDSLLIQNSLNTYACTPYYTKLSMMWHKILQQFSRRDQVQNNK